MSLSRQSRGSTSSKDKDKESGQDMGEAWFCGGCKKDLRMLTVDF